MDDLTNFAYKGRGSKNPEIMQTYFMMVPFERSCLHLLLKRCLRLWHRIHPTNMSSSSPISMVMLCNLPPFPRNFRFPKHRQLTRFHRVSLIQILNTALTLYSNISWDLVILLYPYVSANMSWPKTHSQVYHNILVGADLTSALPKCSLE